jgi:hypothetical protein
VDAATELQADTGEPKYLSDEVLGNFAEALRGSDRGTPAYPR